MKDQNRRFILYFLKKQAAESAVDLDLLSPGNYFFLRQFLRKMNFAELEPMAQC